MVLDDVGCEAFWHGFNLRAHDGKSAIDRLLYLSFFDHLIFIGDSQALRPRLNMLHCPVFLSDRRLIKVIYAQVVTIAQAENRILVRAQHLAGVDPGPAARFEHQLLERVLVLCLLRRVLAPEVRQALVGARHSRHVAAERRLLRAFAIEMIVTIWLHNIFLITN